MHGAGGVPSANEDEQANEEIQQTDKAQVVFYVQGFLSGGGD
jgi:hypothetical protein